MYFLIIVRHFPAIFGDENFRRFFQVSGPVVVPKPLPKFEQLLLLHSRQTPYIGQCLQKSVVVRLHCLHPGLLQHNLREPHMIGCRLLPPRQDAPSPVIPCKQRFCNPVKTVQENRHRRIHFQAVLPHNAVVCEKPHARFSGPLEGFAKSRLGIPIRLQTTDPFHLNHKQQIRFITLPARFHQFLHMFDRTLGRRIRESRHPLPLQRHALDLDVGLPPGCTLHIEIKPGAAEGFLRPDQSDIPVETSRPQPFTRHFVRRIGVHVDQTSLLLHDHKIICCGAGGIPTLLQIYPGMICQKLPASARIFYMHFRPRAHQVHIGDKAVWTLYKLRGDNLCVLHILLP